MFQIWYTHSGSTPPVGHVTQFRNFGAPLITFEQIELRITVHFKFGTDLEDGPVLHTDHKTATKWAWPGSRDPGSKFWDSL